MIYRRYDKVDPSPTERSNGHTLRPLKAATSLLLLASKATKETPKARVHKIFDAHAEFSGSVFQERDDEHIAEAEAELDQRMKTLEELMAILGQRNATRAKPQQRRRVGEEDTFVAR